MAKNNKPVHAVRLAEGDLSERSRRRAQELAATPTWGPRCRCNYPIRGLRIGVCSCRPTDRQISCPPSADAKSQRSSPAAFRAHSAAR